MFKTQSDQNLNLTQSCREKFRKHRHSVQKTSNSVRKYHQPHIRRHPTGLQVFQRDQNPLYVVRPSLPYFQPISKLRLMERGCEFPSTIFLYLQKYRWKKIKIIEIWSAERNRWFAWETNCRRLMEKEKKCCKTKSNRT